MKKEKEVFLSATYEDLKDLIEEVKSILAERGYKVIHFKNYDFHNGTSSKHRHDVCVDKAKGTPCYLLIIDGRGGALYDGDYTDYRGLTVTHAEFKAASSQPNNKNKKIFIFVRKDVRLYFGLWKKTAPGQRDSLPEEVEQGVLRLLEDIDKQGNPWVYDFDHLKELKEILSEKFPKPRKQWIKIVIFGILIFLMITIYKFIPNPYLCYGYNPIKINKETIEFDWTGASYECRFGIANSGILTVRNPVLHLYFIDGATVTLGSDTREWQKNDDVNYFWSKKIDIHGGLGRIDFAERAYPVNVNFHKKGINNVEYIINSNGFQKKGVIKIINRH